jgi:actin-related protein
MLRYAYTNLSTDPSTAPLLFVEPNLNVRYNRTRATELAFETFSVPSFDIMKSALLSSFAAGRSTCIVVDSGETATYAVPVIDGGILTRAMMRYNIGGQYITDCLR